MIIRPTVMLLLISTWCHAQQTYSDSLLKHRAHYKQEFITSEHSPLKKDDTALLRFYAPNEQYRVTARLKKTPKAKPFQMPTHSGETRKYRQYGTLEFTIAGAKQTLQVYQSMDLIKRDEKYKKHLFVPFTDFTSNFDTYGGGRYIDLSTDDIRKNGMIELDFNKCYNPYCAYAEGYSCPIPPVENRLQVPILAGEMMYGKPIHD